MRETKINLPKWLSRRHEMLWEAFNNKTFRLEDAINVLQEKNNDSKQEIPTFISELRRAGWLDVKLDPIDSRKKLYSLKGKDEIIKHVFSINSRALSRTDIEKILKKAADLIRTRVDYKFILILLFLKRISDKWELEYERAFKEAIEDGLDETDAKKEAKNATYHDFVIPEEYLWDEIRENTDRLSEKFSEALKILAERNPELKDILDDVDFIQFTTNSENAELLKQLVELFSEKKLHHVAPDILGDAYEWIMRYFAPQKAKEGEVYTPREVIKLLVEILEPKPKQSVYDPACASAGMLIISHKHVEENHGRNGAEKLFLFGQEANHKTLGFGKMNLYIHNIINAQLAFGDTLLYPKFKDNEGVKQFDIVIANPPWNQDGYDENVVKRGEFSKKRFSFGHVPKQSADWAWIQHMLASAEDDSGRVGIVIDNGCLFRGGKEKSIRMKVLEADLIECVILLPEKLFYNTGAPGAIIIFNKNKEEARKNKILFINASNEYEKHPDVRKLNIIGENGIKKIADSYKKFKDIQGFSKVVALEEIKDPEKDYNLNVSLYVFPEEETEDMDVKKEWSEMKSMEQEILSTNEKIGKILEEIG